MEKGLQNGLQKDAESIVNFICKKCDFKCYKHSEWIRHINTLKHQKDYNGLQKNANDAPVNEFACLCGKIYKHRQGLHKHKKLCTFSDTITNNDNNNSDENVKEICDKELIISLLKQNAELLEIIKNGTSSINNCNNTINSHNKTFNLQVFLNETCKDAMNISEFVESIKLQVSDLENVGRVGYIEGISNIIIKNLQALEVEKRPIHCTDQKREVIYVKDDNIWEKEDETNKKVRKLVRSVAHKNICMLKAFRDKYPDCEQYESRRSSQYNKLVIEAMGGKGDDDYEKNTKIIKKIARAVGIDKS